jgi:hypothetical protein
VAWLTQKPSELKNQDTLAMIEIESRRADRQECQLQDHSVEKVQETLSRWGGAVRLCLTQARHDRR